MVFSERVSSIDAFALALEGNPYYPFTKVSKSVNRFQLRVRYTRVYVAMAVFFIRIILMIVMVELDGGQFLLYAVVAFLWSLLTLYWYKDARVYTLDGVRFRCVFSVSRAGSTTVAYHNIYIRLRKRTNTNGRTLYYLTFNGYTIDKYVLTSPSEDVETLRDVGQRLAANLNINFFSDANVSHHHVIRHVRPKNNGFTLTRNKQAPAPAATSTAFDAIDAFQNALNRRSTEEDETNAQRGNVLRAIMLMKSEPVKEEPSPPPGSSPTHSRPLPRPATMAGSGELGPPSLTGSPRNSKENGPPNYSLASRRPPFPAGSSPPPPSIASISSPTGLGVPKIASLGSLTPGGVRHRGSGGPTMALPGSASAMS